MTPNVEVDPVTDRLRILEYVNAPLPADLFDELCPSQLLPIRMRDKWAPLVIRCLEGGPRRFGELRVPLARVSAKELSRSLRNLRRDGFVSRSVDGRSVTYGLTPLGRSLLDPLDKFCDWAAAHWDELLDARESAAVAGD